MPDMVRLAMERNLANAELLGDADRAKRIQARLSKLDKAPTAVAEAPVVKKAAAKKTAKKAAKK